MPPDFLTPSSVQRTLEVSDIALHCSRSYISFGDVYQNGRQNKEIGIRIATQTLL